MRWSRRTPITCEFCRAQPVPINAEFTMLFGRVFLCSELKSQYAQPSTSGTNINELPQLLQAIHTLKPTVFKTGSQQWQRKCGGHRLCMQLQDTQRFSLLYHRQPSQQPAQHQRVDATSDTAATTTAAASVHTSRHNNSKQSHCDTTTSRQQHTGTHQIDPFLTCQPAWQRPPVAQCAVASRVAIDVCAAAAATV